MDAPLFGQVKKFPLAAALGAAVVVAVFLFPAGIGAVSYTHLVQTVHKARCLIVLCVSLKLFEFGIIQYALYKTEVLGADVIRHCKMCIRDRLIPAGTGMKRYRDVQLNTDAIIAAEEAERAARAEEEARAAAEAEKSEKVKKEAADEEELSEEDAELTEETPEEVLLDEAIDEELDEEAEEEAEAEGEE